MATLKIVIKPNSAKDQLIQLAKVLESSGQVIFKGNVLGDEQKNQLTQMGIQRYQRRMVEGEL
jgi:hypothetical protein